MAHLAAGPGLQLTVKMQLCAPIRQMFGPILYVGADQVFHHSIRVALRRAQGQAADGADELLELAGDASIDRPVARVMGSGRDLVDQYLTLSGDEHFYSQQSNKVHGLGNASGDVHRVSGQGL